MAGYKIENVVEDCQQEFLPISASFERRIVVYSENSLWIKLFRLIEREKLLILATHNEDIFSANNEKKEYRKKKKITFITKRKRERNYNI